MLFALYHITPVAPAVDIPGRHGSWQGGVDGEAEAEEAGQRPPQAIGGGTGRARAVCTVSSKSTIIQ